MGKFQIYFFVGLFLAVILLAFRIFYPFLVPLSIAATLAVLFHRFHEKLTHAVGGRRGWAAFLVVALVVLVIIIPLSFIGTKVVQEAVGFSMKFSANGGQGISQGLSAVQKQVSAYLPGAPINLNKYVVQGADWLSQNIGTIFAKVAGATIELFINIAIAIIAFFFFLKDGKGIVRTIAELSPLPDKDDYEILGKLEMAINSVIKGSLSVSLARGLSAWGGLTVFGVPNPILLGGAAAVAAFIPSAATILIIVPSAIYLFATGSTVGGVGLIIWEIMTIIFVDNMLAPLLMRKGMHLHPVLILLSVMGGVGFFGPIGVLLGPLVISLLFAMIDIYKILLSSEKAGSG